MDEQTARPPAMIHIRPNDTMRLEMKKDTDERGHYDLRPHEIWWRSCYSCLEEHGYIVRPRFRPDWKPSWRGTDLDPLLVEDSIPLPYKRTLDARRKSDGTLVCIKRAAADNDEVGIAQYFSAPERRADPRNHCVPILDHFSEVIDGATEHFIVMPLLREFDSPPFFAMSEVVDFMRQSLQGLAFLHENDTAHRDYCALNLMMDPTLVFPEGYHPSSPSLNPQGHGVSKSRPRSEVGSIAYFITDFGLSTRFRIGEEPRLVRGIDCQDKEVPELSQWTPYDPFPVDIFTLGNLFKKRLLREYSDLTLFEPLAEAMTNQEPTARPKISGANETFENIARQLRPYQLRWRLHSPRDGRVRRFLTNVDSITRECKFYWRSKFSRSKRTD